MVKGALAVNAVQYPADVVLHLGVDGGHAAGAAAPRPEADHAHLDDSGVVMPRQHLTHPTRVTQVTVATMMSTSSMSADPLSPAQLSPASPPAHSCPSPGAHIVVF